MSKHVWAKIKDKNVRGPIHIVRGKYQGTGMSQIECFMKVIAS